MREAPIKFSQLDRIANSAVIVILCFQFALSLASAVGMSGFEKANDKDLWYTGLKSSIDAHSSVSAKWADLEHSAINMDSFKLWEIDNRTSLQFTLSESHGVLNKALNILTSNKGLGGWLDKQSLKVAGPGVLPHHVAARVATERHSFPK